MLAVGFIASLKRGSVCLYLLYDSQLTFSIPNLDLWFGSDTRKYQHSEDGKHADWHHERGARSFRHNGHYP